jgi:HD-like signal output (HDOD) protein/CheY-like chemotaxis protein
MATQPDISRQQPRALLVVEGQSLLREALALVLSKEGYGVLQASGAADALKVMAGIAPNLVILDWDLPGQGAPQLMICMRDSPTLSPVPVMVMSASAAKRDVIAAVGRGARDYILKGNAPLQNLIDRVAHHLAGKKPTQSPRSEAGPVAETRADQPLPTVPDALERVRALKPALSRSALEERLDACGQMKALSPAVAQVLKLTTNPRCPSDTIAKAIGSDPALALKILKLANSAVYTRGAPVESVLKAVVRIGTERIRETVLNISVVDQFSSDASIADLSANLFWEHSLAVGLLSAELASSEEEKHAAFTCGLLHDIGRVVLAQQVGELYTEVLRASRELGLPVEVLESRLLLMTHAEAVARVFRSWSLSKELATPIVHHHRSLETIRSEAVGNVRETARLVLADRLAHALLLGDSGNDTLYPFEPLLQFLGIDGAKLAAISESALQKCDDVKFAMLSNVNATAWPNHRDLIRERLGRVFIPLVISAQPELDPVRLFCRTLGGEHEGTPNMAVVHMPSQRERAALSAALVKAESNLSCAPLPAVIVSSTGTLSLEPEALPNRSVQLLPLPVTTARFLAAIRTVLRT